MKKLLLTMAATLIAVGAFAQGSLIVVNNTDNIAYFTTTVGNLAPADQATTWGGTFPIAGSGLFTGDGSSIAAIAGGPTFRGLLYGGTSASSMQLQTTSLMADIGNEGQIVPIAPCTFDGKSFGQVSLPIGSVAYFQLIVTTDPGNPLADPAGTALTGWDTGYYAGASMVFTAIPQALGTAYIYSAAASSTWTSGTANQELVPIDYLGGLVGGIEVSYGNPVPEPGTFALAGLGLAALLVFRRRN